MLPVLFHIGKLPVRSYGTLLVIGFLLSLWRVMKVCERRMATEPEGSPRRISPDVAFDLGIAVLITGLIGARVVFVLLDWKNYASRPLEMLRVWEGGLSLHGCLIFGILCILILSRFRKFALLPTLDLATPSFALAYAFGRIGCFLNGCCYGSACSLPWGVRFHDENHPNLFTPPSHPVQLYDTFINFAAFYVLTRIEKRPRRDGEMFWGYIAFYGLERFALEYFRAGATSTYVVPSLHLTDTHIISIVMMLAGLVGIAWLRRNRPAYHDADVARIPPTAPTPTTPVVEA